MISNGKTVSQLSPTPARTSPSRSPSKDPTSVTEVVVIAFVIVVVSAIVRHPTDFISVGRLSKASSSLRWVNRRAKCTPKSPKIYFPSGAPTLVFRLIFRAMPRIFIRGPHPPRFIIIGLSRNRANEEERTTRRRDSRFARVEGRGGKYIASLCRAIFSLEFINTPRTAIEERTRCFSTQQFGNSGWKSRSGARKSFTIFRRTHFEHLTRLREESRFTEVFLLLFVSFSTTRVVIRGHAGFPINRELPRR